MSKAPSGFDEKCQERLVKESLDEMCESILETYDPSEVVYVDEKDGDALVRIWGQEVRLELSCHVEPS